jgi:hypothetical protein
VKLLSAYLGNKVNFLRVTRNLFTINYEFLYDYLPFLYPIADTHILISGHMNICHKLNFNLNYDFLINL